MYNVGDKLIVTATEKIRNWEHGDILVIVEVDKKDSDCTYRCGIVDGSRPGARWTRADQVTLYEPDKSIEGTEVDINKVQIGDVIRNKHYSRTILLVTHIYVAGEEHVKVTCMGLTGISKKILELSKKQLSSYTHIHNISDIYSSIDI